MRPPISPIRQLSAILKTAFPSLLAKVTPNLVFTHVAKWSGDATLSGNAAALFTIGGCGTSAVFGNVLFGNGTKTVCVRGLMPPSFLCIPKTPSPQSIKMVGRSAFSKAGLPANVLGKTMTTVLDA